MAYKSNDPMFRDLDDEEEAAFREWAQVNYNRGTQINETWHPVVQDECRRCNEGGRT